jgi:hypothetical protein
LHGKRAAGTWIDGVGLVFDIIPVMRRITEIIGINKTFSWAELQKKKKKQGAGK